MWSAGTINGEEDSAWVGEQSTLYETIQKPNSSKTTANYASFSESGACENETSAIDNNYIT